MVPAPPMAILASPMSHSVSLQSPCLNGYGQGAIYLHRDAPTEQIDGEYQQALVHVRPAQDSLHAGQRSPGDSYPLALPQVGMRERGQGGVDHLLDGFNLIVRDRRQPIPSVSQDADKATSPTDFDVTCMVHLVVRKEVAGKHGHADAAPNPV